METRPIEIRPIEINARTLLEKFPDNYQEIIQQSAAVNKKYTTDEEFAAILGKLGHFKSQQEDRKLAYEILTSNFRSALWIIFILWYLVFFRKYLEEHSNETFFLLVQFCLGLLVTNLVYNVIVVWSMVKLLLDNALSTRYYRFENQWTKVRHLILVWTTYLCGCFSIGITIVDVCFGPIDKTHHHMTIVLLWSTVVWCIGVACFHTHSFPIYKIHAKWIYGYVVHGRNLVGVDPNGASSIQPKNKKSMCEVFDDCIVTHRNITNWAIEKY